jgi:hypothetical protein
MGLLTFLQIPTSRSHCNNLLSHVFSSKHPGILYALFASYVYTTSVCKVPLLVVSDPKQRQILASSFIVLILFKTQCYICTQLRNQTSRKV